jgi:hypothetical protein
MGELGIMFLLHVALIGMIDQMNDEEFVNFLFGKLVKHVDTDMIDLQDDDTCCDHLEFQQLTLTT